MITRLRRIAAAAAAAILLAGCVHTGSTGAQVGETERLGSVSLPVSCSPAAQAAFDHAVALLHHMTYPAAREAFEDVARIDPSCAMAHWGVAMTLFEPLWPTRPGPAELRAGWHAVQQAQRLAPPTERERLFVAAAAAFFEGHESADYWARIRRWEHAMARVHTAFPDDVEAAAFYALAHLAVAPADTASSGNNERAAHLLLSVYERNPDHPGAMHYLVHANDAAGRAHESLDVTRKYQTVAPRNPHALHMPTHIHTRLGDWPAVIEGNLKAADAALEHRVGNHVWDEFPHAVEYLVYAYLQQGANEDAVAQWERLRTTPDLQPSFKTAFHLASIPARIVLERRLWEDAVALEPREPATLDWDRYPWPESVTWFARGLGAARLGNVAIADSALDRLRALETVARDAGEDLFARNIRILALGVEAWRTHAQGDTAGSVARMREAVTLELETPKHAVTPAPTLPAPELLGDLLLEQGHATEALAAYQQSLTLYPRRFNSMLGAARAGRAARGEAARGGTRIL